MTFNNNLDRDIVTLERFHDFREEAERKGFRYFLEVFDPNVAGAVNPEILPQYTNDMITRMLAGIGPAGRPLFLKIVYHGPEAMQELVRFDPNLVVGILGGSAGTTRDAFQLLHDAQKYGARVALFGRKINNAENQLAFVHFLRLIVEGQVGPIDAVRAYHAVLARLGLRPNRPLGGRPHLDRPVDELFGNQEFGGRPATAESRDDFDHAGASAGPFHCRLRERCVSLSVPLRSEGRAQRQKRAPAVVKRRWSPNRARRFLAITTAEFRPTVKLLVSNGRPDFTRMSPAERLTYHRERLGLGR